MPDYSTSVGELLETLGRNRNGKRAAAAPPPPNPVSDK